MSFFSLQPTFRSLKNGFLDINYCSSCLFCLTIAKPKSTKKRTCDLFLVLPFEPSDFCGYGQYMQIRHGRHKLERLTSILKNHFPNCGMWAADVSFSLGEKIIYSVYFGIRGSKVQT